MRIRHKNKKVGKKTKKKSPPTLTKLKRADDNELERNLRLKKVDASKQLRLAMETEEERRENGAAKQLRLAMEMDG